MNKIVVITGGSSGIGKEIAELFRKNKDIVYTLNRSNANDVNNFVCDISNEEVVERIINQIGEKHKNIDIVINCAGYGISGALELTSVSDMENIFDVNMKGTFLVNKYATKFLKEHSTIINIASACALFPLPFRGLYCSSKSAVNMYSHCLNLELKPSKINVCSICLGETKTNFTKNRIKNFETNSRYGNRIANAAYSIDKKDDKRMPADKVAKKIFKIANKKRVKPMVIISGKMKFLYFISKFIPLSWLIQFTQKFMGGHKEFKNNPYIDNNK